MSLISGVRAIRSLLARVKILLSSLKNNSFDFDAL